MPSTINPPAAADIGVRTASCACGALRLTVSGAPRGVYLCSCDACKRTTGSAFAYRAQYGTADIVKVEGEARRWRRIGDAGRWVEHVYCATCGALVWMEGEGLPDAIAVSVGCFADPDFPPPATLYRTAGGHRWVIAPPGSRIAS